VSETVLAGLAVPSGPVSDADRFERARGVRPYGTFSAMPPFICGEAGVSVMTPDTSR
jgi:hypothetical protein